MNRRFFISDMGSKATAAVLTGAAVTHSQISNASEKLQQQTDQALGRLKKQVHDLRQHLNSIESRVTRLELKQLAVFAWLIALSAFTGFDFVSNVAITAAL